MTELQQLVHREPRTCGCPRSRWRLVDLQQQLGWLQHYSLPGVWQVLRRLGIRLHRGRLRLHSPDPAYAAKVFQLDLLRQLAQHHPERVTLVYADEVYLQRQPTLADRWAPVGEEPTAPLACRSNDVARYVGALDAVTGRLTWQHAEHWTVEALGAFLHQLRQAYPDQLLALAWDNWGNHTHRTVQATAAELHIRLVWLPTYAPWTNPIEQLWRWLRQTVVHHHQLAEQWEALQQATTTFFDQFATGSSALLRYVGLLPD